jgi:hypothetical protein
VVSGPGDVALLAVVAVVAVSSGEGSGVGSGWGVGSGVGAAVPIVRRPWFVGPLALGETGLHEHRFDVGLDHELPVPPTRSTATAWVRTRTLGLCLLGLVVRCGSLRSGLPGIG